MILMLIQLLKGLLTISRNQRYRKEKQVHLWFASIKFRQPKEIDTEKEMRKMKKGVNITAYV